MTARASFFATESANTSSQPVLTYAAPYTRPVSGVGGVGGFGGTQPSEVWRNAFFLSTAHEEGERRGAAPAVDFEARLGAVDAHTADSVAKPV